jgi:nucleoside-diphosphate-sugar epimerase
MIVLVEFMKKYLITGGAGFIGSNMCQRLLQDEGNEVIAFDDLTTGKTSNFDKIKDNPRFSFVQGDVVTIAPRPHSNS